MSEGDYRFAFVDAYSGIGGRRIAAEMLGGLPLIVTEPNRQIRNLNALNFEQDPVFDLPTNLPKSDVVLLQVPFLSASRILDCELDTFYQNVSSLVKMTKAKIVIIEAKDHKSFGPILDEVGSLLIAFGYHVTHKVYRSREFGLPHNAKRRFIVASNIPMELSEPETIATPKVSDILEQNIKTSLSADEYVLLRDYQIDCNKQTGLIFCGYRKCRKSRQIAYEQTHQSRAHSPQNRIYRSDGMMPTITHADPSARIWILHKGKVRRLSLREAYRAYGYPDTFCLPQSKTLGIKGLANSTPIPMASFVLKQALDSDTPL